jgi:N-methylhydantoinase A
MGSQQGGRVQVKYRLGVDVGGIFTDRCSLSGAEGMVHTLKIVSTPDDPSRATAMGIIAVLKRHGVRPEDVTYLPRATTVERNAIL